MISSRSGLGVFAVAVGAVVSVSAGPPPSEKPADRIPVAEARERAKLVHEIHAATLESMHHHFFRRERAVLPARALDDVFAEVEHKTGVKTRWIAVNTPAMSHDHEPKTAFERAAAAELAAGKPSFDKVEDGLYRRAAAIPLGPGCVGCHTRLGAPPTKLPRVAGLVIEIPVRDS